MKTEVTPIKDPILSSCPLHLLPQDILPWSGYNPNFPLIVLKLILPSTRLQGWICTSVLPKFPIEVFKLQRKKKTLAKVEQTAFCMGFQIAGNYLFSIQQLDTSPHYKHFGLRQIKVLREKIPSRATEAMGTSCSLKLPTVNATTLFTQRTLPQQLLKNTQNQQKRTESKIFSELLCHLVLTMHVNTVLL